MSGVKGGRWYTQREGRVQGPFAAGLVSRYILLGRLSMEDKVSQDGQEWHMVRDVPGLIPDILADDSDDPLHEERLQAARRWADERATDRRADQPGEPGDERRQPGDRREIELDEVMQHRGLLRRRGRVGEAKGNLMAALVLTAAILAIAAAGYHAYQNRPEEVVIDCSAVPSFAADFTNCVMVGKDLQSAELSRAILRNTRMSGANLKLAQLDGADMAYIDLGRAQLNDADMTGASLKGADLTNADLSGATLSNADLSFANLTGARINGTDFSGANLSKAIWVDGSVCAADAVGGC